MKIAISGCGIAGAAVAKFLADDGHDVTVFEQAAHCNPVGAGILLQPAGQRVLEKLGILHDVVRESAELDGLWAKQASAKTLVRLKYAWLNSNLKGYGVHRGRLFQRLFDLCEGAGVSVRTGFRVASVRSGSNETVSVVGDNGDTASGFDFVIAADGSRSQLRDFFGMTKYVVDYDYAALWTTGPCKYQPGTLVQVVRGTHSLVGLLPIGRGESSFFWGLPVDSFDELASGSLDVWKQEVLQVFPEVETMLGNIHDFNDLTFARYRHVVMDRWYQDRVLFMGDAAHATSPHLGQGVNLALEDAECFASSLRATGDFGDACRLYSRRRRWKLRYFQQVTRLLSPFFQGQGVARGRVRDAFLPLFPHTPFVRREMIRTLTGDKRGWIG